MFGYSPGSTAGGRSCCRAPPTDGPPWARGVAAGAIGYGRFVEKPSDVAKVPRGVPSIVDGTAGRAAAGLFGAASFVRRKRSLHPNGIGFEATLTIDPQRTLGAELLDRAGEHRCVVRLSRAIGLPERWRDILGLAVRVLDADRRIRQDLLFSSVAGDGTVARHVLAPTRSFVDRPLSSVLPYDTAAGRCTLLADGSGTAAEAASRLASAGASFASGDLVFALRAADGGELIELGELRGHGALSPDQSDGLRFNPYHAEPDLMPGGIINALRRRAYAASQRGRQRVGNGSR